MTEVTFHTGVADTVGYACRLLRKASRSGARVAVHGPSPVLDRLDLALWMFEPLEFLPHAALPRDAGDATRVARSPILLVHPGAQAEGCPVAVSLGAVGPGAEAEDFERVIEIVGMDAAERESARRRWRDWERAGQVPAHVNAAA